MKKKRRNFFHWFSSHHSFLSNLYSLLPTLELNSPKKTQLTEPRTTQQQIHTALCFGAKHSNNYNSIFPTCFNLQKRSLPRFLGPRSPRPSFGPPPRSPFFRGPPRPPFGPPNPTLGLPRPGNFPPRSPYRSRPPFLHSLSVTSTSSTSPPIYQHQISDQGPLVRKSSWDRTTTNDPAYSTNEPTYPSSDDRIEDEFRMISPASPTSPPTTDLFPRIQIPQHTTNKKPQLPQQLSQQSQLSQQQQQQQREPSFDMEQYKTDSIFSLSKQLVIMSKDMETHLIVGHITKVDKAFHTSYLHTLYSPAYVTFSLHINVG